MMTEANTSERVLVVHRYDELYENSRSRDVEELKWFCCPNDFSNISFIELMEDHEDGPAHFATWIIILSAASKCAARGVLFRSATKSAHNAKSIARLARLDTAVVEVAIERLIGFGWLKSIPIEEAEALAEKALAARRKRRKRPAVKRQSGDGQVRSKRRQLPIEEKGIEEKRKKEKDPPPEDPKRVVVDSVLDLPDGFDLAGWWNDLAGSVDGNRLVDVTPSQLADFAELRSEFLPSVDLIAEVPRRVAESKFVRTAERGFRSLADFLDRDKLTKIVQGHYADEQGSGESRPRSVFDRKLDDGEEPEAVGGAA
ncbi:MAG: hypothetical protein AAF581_10990 [Planctomycetota bacterium]